MSFKRYHLQLKSHRTTISLDKIISDIIAIKLGKTPDSKEAHTAVRKQLDGFLSDGIWQSGRGLGEYVTRLAILFITDNDLSEKYLEYRIGHCDEDLDLFQK